VRDNLDSFFAKIESFCLSRGLGVIPFLCIPRIHIPTNVETFEFGEDALTQAHVRELGTAADDEFTAIETDLRAYLGVHTKDCNNMLLPVKKSVDNGPISSRPSAGSPRLRRGRGESVRVTVPLENPLAVNLELRGLQLLYLHLVTGEKPRYDDIRLFGNPDSVLLIRQPRR